MELSLQTRTVADRTVLEVGGEIDVYTAPKLKERLLDLVAGGTKQIVVDLESVEFLDSTGLGVLVGGLRRVRSQGGHLALVCTQERILKIFRITGLATFFDIHPSVDAAIEAVGGPGDSSDGGNASDESQSSSTGGSGGGSRSAGGAETPVTGQHPDGAHPAGGRDHGDAAGSPPTPGT